MNKIYPQAPVPVTCAGIQRPKCSNKPNGKGANDLNHQKDPAPTSDVGVQQQSTTKYPVPRVQMT